MNGDFSALLGLDNRSSLQGAIELFRLGDGSRPQYDRSFDASHENSWPANNEHPGVTSVVVKADGGLIRLR